MIENQPRTFQKIASALFNGLASFFITVVNKTVLTTFNFPSFLFLGLGQLIATVVILYVSKTLKLIEFPDMTRKTFQIVFPLPLIFFGNMFFGLGGTQSLSLPMFTALRRFSILATMILEVFILGTKPEFMVKISVFSMIAGALVAAADDLSFQLKGYIYITLCNIFTGFYQVYIKKKLDSDKMAKYGLMFYNSLFSLFPVIILSLVTGDFEKVINFDRWSDTLFISQFLFSCFMGFLLAFSTFLCTLYNSALTTAMVGSIKNVLLTYLGMLIGGDYIFSWVNFIGLNISVVGSLLYSYVAIKPEKSKEEHQESTKKVPIV